MFQSASWQSINPLSLPCDDTLDLSPHLNGIVYSSTIQLQKIFAVLANAQASLTEEQTTYSQNYGFFSFSKNYFYEN